MIMLLTGPHGHHRDLDARGQIRMPVRWGWWKQMWRERSCAKVTGHCWHPRLFTMWQCCMCAAADDHFTIQRCLYCEQGEVY